MDSPVNSILQQSACHNTRFLTVRRVQQGFAFLFLTAFLAQTGAAEEPIIPFIEGLRERGYFDTAVEYIDVTSQRGDLPADLKAQLGLERGIILQQKGAVSRIPEDREKAFSDSEQALRKFISEHPQHAQAALANSMLGELLFERARSLIWKTDDVESAEERRALQDSARTLIDQAKDIFQKAQDQYKVAYDAFPKFIDESRDEEEYRKRQEAEAKYLRAWFNLVRCTYERGQTFDKGTEDRKKTLIEAADLFDKIHTSRRTNQIGLHARLMMGKCFQEQDDLGRALGIYNEMLSHKSENPAVEMLKGIAQHYRLICLNDPQKNDHRLAIQEAATWLQANRQLSTTQSGLGILWEKAIAEEKLGSSRELDEKEKESVLRAAMNDAAQVGKYPGPYKDPAAAMSRRLSVALGEKNREPRDFSAAFERARGMIAQIQQLSDDVTKATDDNDRAQKKSAFDNHLTEVGRLLQLALDLRESDSDAKAVAQARYLLSFVLLRQGKALDAMILSSYCFEKDATADPDTALNATEIAMAAAVSAWNQAPGKDRDFETRALRDICQKILELYPQSSRGGEARMRLGSVYRTMNQPVEGAKWYLQVPETDPQFASARINAGQSYWSAWTLATAMAAANPEGQLTPAAELVAWKTEARNLLTQGIQLTRTKIGDAAKPTDELTAAEVSLASIMNLDGEFPATIERLTKGAENSVVAAIEVPAGTARPDEGVQSKSFAGLTYRLLLRAYVGTQQIDQALQTMTQLEKVGGEDILAAYTQLGIELQEELKRLKQAGENDRLAQVRSSFEMFLQKVYESRDKSDYNSLLWIGETYYGLGQGVSGDPAAAAGYYSKAGDAYSEILTGGLANAESKSAVQLRLARCLRQQKQFPEAMQIVEEILAQNAMTLDAQFEAAYVLTDWGAENEPAKFTEAIQGKKDAAGKATAVWGWSQLARRLQQISAKDPAGELKGRFVDARYELSNSRRRFAMVSEADADKQRKAAMAEVTSFVQAVRDLDEVSFARFDRLFQDLQADLGQAPTPLERILATETPETVPPETPVMTPNSAAASPKTTQPVAVAEPDGSGWLLPVLGLSLCLGLAGGFFVFLRKPRHKVRIPGPANAPKFAGVAATAETVSAIPEGLSFGASAEPDFSGLGMAGSARKATPAARPAVKSAAKPPVADAGPKPAAAAAAEVRQKTAAPPGEAVAVRRPAPVTPAAGAPAASGPAATMAPGPPAAAAGEAPRKPQPRPISAGDGVPVAGTAAVDAAPKPRPKPVAPTEGAGQPAPADAPQPRPRPTPAADGSAPAVPPGPDAAPKPRPRPVAPVDSTAAAPLPADVPPRPRLKSAPVTDGSAAPGAAAADTPPRPRPRPVATPDVSASSGSPDAPPKPRPKPAAPSGEAAPGNPAVRPAAPKPPVEGASGERPAVRPAADLPAPPKRPKPPESE